MPGKQSATPGKPGRSVQKKAKTDYRYLLAEYPNIWDNCSAQDERKIMSYAEEYKKFLNTVKTEREFVKEAIHRAEAKGFSNIENHTDLKPGDKVYYSVKEKGLLLAVIGKRPMTEGFNMLGAHIDSPRLDLKPNPIFEEEEMVFLKTHYYGGIKKYQWTTIPLAIHGIMIRKDGTEISVNIGEEDHDPVFYITDLLPHLGAEQMSRKGSDIVKGEDLNVLIGGRPVIEKDTKNAYKVAILLLLNEKYGIIEKDFVSAELEIVPAMKARDVGFDRAFIASYGHDDRVCAYPALTAILDQKKPGKTIICMLSDKEEIGSYGNTGANSRIYENFWIELYIKSTGSFDELSYRKALSSAKMLSADVSNGYDPKYASVSDPKNSAYMSHGIKLEKYVGSRGKSGTNDANSEFIAEVIRVFNERNIRWQTGELGKVDEGGGGTISAEMSSYGLDVLDCGVPVLSMHAPYEVISKADLYMTFLAYKAFIEDI
ncbi:MAG: aminopeptidase [Clostridiaceae bacterium]|nr:aminopeptidase [Clostridiaceae bacterium]